MAQTITERVYDELTHKLRQWEKLAPAPHELLGALKSWSQIGNADIEAAANAAAGLAVKGSQRSVKAFANVPDVPAALAHLRTAHAAIKAQLDAERSAPPRDGGFAGVKGWTENATIEDAASQMDNLWRGWMSSFRVFTRDPEKGARRAAQHWAEVLSRNATYDRVPAAQRVYNLLDQAIDQPTEAAAVPYIGRALVELRNIVRELKAGRGFKGVGVKATKAHYPVVRINGVPVHLDFDPWRRSHGVGSEKKPDMNMYAFWTFKVNGEQYQESGKFMDALRKALAGVELKPSTFVRVLG